jgi:hypothetical protein
MSPEARAARSKGGTAAQSTDTLVRRIVANAGSLTEEQKATLRGLLAPAGGASE